MSSKAYFQKVATQWDVMRQAFFSESVRDIAYSKGNLTTGMIAADIGAGTGFITEGLLRRGIQVIAVDESSEMLNQLKNTFNSDEGLSCLIGESLSLPIPDGTVGSAFANMYLHHVEQPGMAIKEMARIVQPGGKVVLTDLNTHTYDFLTTEQHDRWMGFDQEEVRKWFEEAGLVNIEIADIEQSCCSESACGQKAKIGIFVAVGEKIERH